MDGFQVNKDYYYHKTAHNTYRHAARSMSSLMPMTSSPLYQSASLLSTTSSLASTAIMQNMHARVVLEIREHSPSALAVRPWRAEELLIRHCEVAVASHSSNDNSISSNSLQKTQGSGGGRGGREVLNPTPWCLHQYTKEIEEF